MKKHIKFIIVFAIAMAFLLAGCSKDTDEKTFIYYEENNIKLPDDITNIYDMISLQNGGISILTDTKAELGRVFELKKDSNLWTQTNGTWNGLTNSVIFDACFLDEKTNYSSVLYNALLAKNEEEGAQLSPKYFIIQQDGTNTELSLDLSAGDKIEENNLFHFMAKNENSVIGIDNAQIIYSFSKTGQLQYTSDVVKNANANLLETLQVDDVFYLILDNSNVICLDVKSGKLTTGNKKITNFLKYKKEEYAAYLDIPSNKIYALNANKLYSYDLATEKKEQLLDLQYYDLRNGKRFQICTDSNGKLFISYILGNGEVKLNSYKYIKKGIEVKKSPLKIYSLTENYLLENFVSGFKIKYPKIPVEIEYGYTSENGKTETDAINLLNTEMLAGNGPDILFMDGMDCSTYYQNGLLMDLKNITDIDELKKTLYPNMLSPYQDGDIQYALPLGFQLYGIVGEKDLINTFSETNKFLEHLENMNLDFAISDETLSDVAHIVYLKDIPNCFLENGTLDSDKLTEFYTNLNRLYKLSGNSFGESNTTSTLFRPYGFEPLDADIQWIYYDHLPFAASAYYRADSFFAVKYLTKEKGFRQKYLYENENLLYRDDNIVAVSKQTTQTANIKKFVNYILDDGQAIIAENLLSLPTNKTALKELLVKEKSQKPSTLFEFGFGDNPEMISLKGIPFNNKEFKKLNDEISNAIPSKYDDPKIIETILNGANDYCLNRKSLDQAVNDTVEKILLYTKE